jgi:hypothetical protein
MKEQFKIKKPSALKHGGYSATNVLPGEDPVEFDKLRRGLFEELNPHGTFEKAIVSDIARFVWRKQNLNIIRSMQQSFRPVTVIEYRIVDPKNPGETAIVREKMPSDQDRQSIAVEPPSDHPERIEPPSSDSLMEELSIQERLDAMIDRSLRRLLFVRGLKSISPPASLPRSRQSALLDEKGHRK